MRLWGSCSASLPSGFRSSNSRSRLIGLLAQALGKLFGDAVSGPQLFLDVRQLPPGFLQEQFANEEVHHRKEVEKESCGVGCDQRPVLLEKQSFERNKEGKFLEQEKPQGQKEDRCREEYVGNHGCLLAERLVLPEVGDGQPQRINGNPSVRYTIADDEHK